jgi:class 3 adenylate cyclase
VLRAHNAVVRAELSRYGGFEVKSLGDGFMVAFQSARRGVQCAVALQRAFAAHSEAHPDPPPRVRIGLHVGEVIREADDFFGKTVIMAARIAAAAQGREILVSGLLCALVESSGDVRFGEPRSLALKGLEGMHEIRPVIWT